MSPVAMSRSVISRSTSRATPGLHLVDEALHPEPEEAQLLGGGLGAFLAILGGGGDGEITELDQLRPLVA